MCFITVCVSDEGTFPRHSRRVGLKGELGEAGSPSTFQECRGPNSAFQDCMARTFTCLAI